MQEEDSAVDVSEVYFLVLHWLLDGPCRRAAQALLQEVEQHGLLPTTHAASGASRPTPYQQLLQQHRGVPSTGLLQLLQQALKQVQRSDHAGAQGLSTLLAEGPLAALPTLRQLPAHRQIPAWLSQPTRANSLAQQLLLREGGRCRGSSSRRLPLRTSAARYGHHATFRGHGFPVFCVLFDQQGSRVVTGADDAIIKVWSLQTGMLLVSARGHTGELSDLALSCDSKLLASGATDAEVRIWSMQDNNLGQNLAVLRGHGGPINLIAFHPTMPLALLSASGDGTVRLWDALDPHFPPLVLRPETAAAAVTAGEAGAQAGAAGGDAEDLAGVAAALAATAAAGAAANAGRGTGARVGAGLQQVVIEDAESPVAMLGCAWSPCGRYIAAGSRDCNIYMWHWDLASQTAQDADQQHTGSAAVGASAHAVLHAADWPQPVALPVLKGHSKGVWQVEFNHAGNMLASGSMDGSARVWMRSTGKEGNTAFAAWKEACSALVLKRLPAAAPAGVAPSPAPKQKQRRPPAEEVLTVNRVLWTANDSKLLLAGSDNVIRIWDAKCWSLQQHLQGHTDAVHVLVGHPYDPRLVLSAGYDGLTILWDAQAGTELQRFSTADTPPLARGSWAPPVIQVVEGRFSPDGMSFVVSDAGGQFSLYALGIPPPLLLSAPYDQFFLRDYDPIVHDAAGFAAYTDPNTGVVIAPVWQAARQYAVTHQTALQQPLCDNHFRPYPEDFQAAYRSGQVLTYVRSGHGGMSMRGTSMRLSPSLEQWPPTVTAAVWKALEDRSELAAKRSSVPSEEATRDAAERMALEHHSRLLSALARGMTLEEEALHIAQMQAAAAAAAASTRSCRQQQQQQDTNMQTQQPAGGASEATREQQETGGGTAGDAVMRAAAAASARQNVRQDAFADRFISEEDILQDLLDDRDNDAVPDSSDSDYSASGQQEGSSSGDLDGLGSDGAGSHSSGSDDGGSSRRTRRSQRRVSRRRRQEQRQQQRQRGGGAAGHNLRPRRGRGGSQSQQEEEGQGGMATRARPHTRSAAAQGTPDPEEHLQVLDEVHHPRQQQQQQRKRRARDSSTTPEDTPENTDSSDSDAARQRQQRQRRRTRRRLDSTPAPGGAAGGPSRRQQRQQGESQHAGAVAAAAAAAGEPHPAPHVEVDPLQAWRPAFCYSWLSSEKQLPGLYVPQLGDAVVYLWQGHKQCLERYPEMPGGRPWECFEQLGRAVWQQQQRWQEQQQQMHWSYDPGGQQQQQHQLQQDFPGAAAVAAARPAAAEAGAASGSVLDATSAAAGAAAAGEAEVATVEDKAAAPVAATPEQYPAAVAAQAEAAPAAAADKPPAAISPHAAAAPVAAAPAAVTPPAAAAQSAGPAADGRVAPARVSAAAAVGGSVDGHPGGSPAAAAGAAATGGAGASQQAAAAVAAAGQQAFKLRHVEPCVVTGLEYVLLPGDFTGAVLTLQLSDPQTIAEVAAAAATANPACCSASDPTSAAAAAAAQGCFQVVLPPPELGHQGYVLLQSQYVALVQRTWEVGSRVQGCCFHQHEDQLTHSWRFGTVTAVREGYLQQPSDPSEPCNSSSSSSSSQQCYKVLWDDGAGGGTSSRQQQDAAWAQQAGRAEAHAAPAAADTTPTRAPAAALPVAATPAAAIPAAAAATAPTASVSAAADASAGGGASGAAAAAAAEAAEAGGFSWCSPWELYAAGVSTDEAVAAWHTPGLTAEEVAHLLQTVDQLRWRQYKFFNAPPSPRAKFVSQHVVRAYNRVIPLPLGLANIQARLSAGYYRSVQALLHDAALIVSNSATFNGPETTFAAKAVQMYTTLSEAAYALQGQQQQQQQQQQQPVGWPADPTAGGDGSWPWQHSQQQHSQQQPAGWPPDPASAAAAGAGQNSTNGWQWQQQGGVCPTGFTAAAEHGQQDAAAAAAAAAGAWEGHWQQQAGAAGYAAGYAAGGDAATAGHLQADGSWQQQQQFWQQQQQQPAEAAMGQGYGAGMQASMEQQGQQTVDGQAAPSALAQQRPRIRLKLHPPAATAAAAGGEEGMPSRLRSGRNTRAAQQQPQQPRSRRSAAQRAREFVAAVSHVGGGSSGEEDSQPQSNSDGADFSSGDERRGGRRRRAGAAAVAPKGPVRHSARLQKQGGVRQYRTLAEGSDDDFESEDDA